MKPLDKYRSIIYDHVKSRRPTENDIDSINAFQIVSAETNVYFSDWTHKDRLTDLVLGEKTLTVNRRYGAGRVRE